MKEIIGDYAGAVLDAEVLIQENNIALDELTQCDTICYRVETMARYDELKTELAKAAFLLSETEINGRLIAVYALDEPLAAGEQHAISYIELPQPKPGSKYPEGIDHLQFVTRLPLPTFRAQHEDISFDEKGLEHRLNPLVKLVGQSVSVKFHDKHMGSVVELEKSYR